MLRCRDGSLYTGWTSDLERRLARHAAGRASRYTASRLPVQLAFALPMPDRGSARREEARIKRLTRAAKLALIDGGGGGPHGRRAGLRSSDGHAVARGPLVADPEPDHAGPRLGLPGDGRRGGRPLPGRRARAAA
ncbi:MAG: GIY-YIG nuclease family protein [Solirubrobacteraceae bacterium]